MCVLTMLTPIVFIRNCSCTFDPDLNNFQTMLTVNSIESQTLYYIETFNCQYIINLLFKSSN